MRQGGPSAINRRVLKLIVEAFFVGLIGLIVALVFSVILLPPFVLVMQFLNNRSVKKTIMKQEANMMKCPSCETLNYRNANF